MFDHSNVRYIKRIVVGSDNPARICTREETEAQMADLNDCLGGTSHPRGTLLSVERSFTLVRIGEHQVVLEWMAYHVGFPRKPPPKTARRAPMPPSAPPSTPARRSDGDAADVADRADADVADAPAAGAAGGTARALDV